jgi:hypothetical protein
MPNLFRTLAVLLLALAATVSAHADPRDRVGAVADAIEDHYFDPARGRAIAEDLRRDADAGTFDALATPQALAEALTTRLRPLDRHFRVRWQAAGDAAAARAPRRPFKPRAPNGIAVVETLPGNVGHLRLTDFAHFDDVDTAARLAMDEALEELSQTRAMIVDLRACRGGSPAMVGYLASAFVAPGADIYNTFRSRTGGTASEAPDSPYANPRTQVPLFVLVDGGTASAAESFAYTLQSAGRATVVGERSAGAANPGGEVEVGDGYTVFVSDGTPINPITHANWEGSGVQPDVAAASDGALDAALQLAHAKR